MVVLAFGEGPLGGDVEYCVIGGVCSLGGGNQDLFMGVWCKLRGEGTFFLLVVEWEKFSCLEWEKFSCLEWEKFSCLGWKKFSCVF